MATDASADRLSGVGFRSERGPVLAALMLCTGLVALDSTIIATSVVNAQAGGRAADKGNVIVDIGNCSER